MSDELRALSGNPFELLLQLDARLRASRLDIAAGQAEVWTGLGFRMGDDWFLAPQDDVREVLTLPSITRVPNVRPWLLGIANIRGSLLTLVDLPQFFGGSPVAPTRSARTVVLNSTRIPLGFAVDEVLGHRQFSPAEQAPSLLEAGHPAWAPYLLGGFRQQGRDWRVLSLHRLSEAEPLMQAGW